MKTKVAIIQFQPVLCNPTANINILSELFESVEDASLVILPELSNAGYNFSHRDEAMEFSEPVGGEGIFQKFLMDQAADKQIHIVSGINEREGSELYNSAILVGPSGIAGKYRKLHLFMNEKDIFLPGNAGLPVFDLGGFRIGIMICFDYLFPEPWRIIAQKGADLICHPSNLLTENPRKCVPGLALMNRIYIATANRIGEERGLHFNGQSFVTSPDGVITRIASPDQPEIVTFELDTEYSGNKMITRRNHVFDDRRPDQYVI